MARALQNPALRVIPQVTNAMAPDENAFNAMAR
jgi:hypothetical protein